MKSFFALVKKDLKVYFSDGRAVVLAFAVPIAIASFFGSMFGGRSGQPQRSRLALQVVDLDQSDISRQILTNLMADENLNVTLNSEAAARETVRQGKAPLAIILPPNFGDAAARTFFGRGEKPQIIIAHDASRNVEVGMAKGILAQHIMQTVSKEVFSGASGAKQAREALASVEAAPGPQTTERKALAEMLGSIGRWMDRSQTSTNPEFKAASGGFAMPFSTQEETTLRQQTAVYNGYAHSFAGMGVQFILMAAIELGVGILVERQRGLWKRLRSAPLSRRVLLGSKAASIAIIATLILTTCFVFARVVFGVRVQGSLVGFALCVVAFSLFAASAGILLSSLGMTPAATRGLAIPVVLIMVMLGGAWVPAFIFPQWLQQVTLSMPTRWAIDGLEAMTWRGLGLESAWKPAVVLLGFAAACGTLAVARFQWEAD